MPYQAHMNNFVIERSLKKHFKTINQQWFYKSKKTLILLIIMLLMGLSILISEIVNTNSTIGNFNLGYIFSAVIITYSLTMLRFSFVVKANNLKDLKNKIASNFTNPIVINITDAPISVDNIEFINIFKWKYFKFYQVANKKIFISANPKSIGIAINLDELTEAQQHQLLHFLKDKALHNIT